MREFVRLLAVALDLAGERHHLPPVLEGRYQVDPAWLWQGNRASASIELPSLRILCRSALSGNPCSSALPRSTGQLRQCSTRLSVCDLPGVFHPFHLWSHHSGPNDTTWIDLSQYSTYNSDDSFPWDSFVISQVNKMGIGEDHEPMYRFNRQLAPISSAKFFSPRVVGENSR